MDNDYRSMQERRKRSGQLERLVTFSEEETKREVKEVQKIPVPPAKKKTRNIS
jgi:hypothetical protein